MTQQQEQRLLHALRALAEDARANEMAELPAAWARSTQFYAASRVCASDEERFLALYNGLGVLLGFDAAKSAVEQTLGGAEEALRAVRSEGDCDEGSESFRYSGEQLDALAAVLRRALFSARHREA